MRKRQVIVACSVTYLAALTVLAAYAMYNISTLTLPIASILPALIVALPPLAGVALETIMSLNERLAAKGQIQASRTFQVTIAFFLIYEAMVATLAGTHIGPIDGLTCGLHDRWQNLYSKKNEARVRAIQDGLDCCGFNSVKDMAYPFEKDGRGSRGCAEAFGRDKACFGPWQQKEREAGIMLLVVVIGVFVWQVLMLMGPSSQSSWLPSNIRLPGSADQIGGPSRPTGRRTIAYRDIEEEAEEEDGSLRREVTDLNNESERAANDRGPTNGMEPWRDASHRNEHLSGN